MKFQIASNSRVFIAGMTGSGKTYLAQRLLNNVSRLVVFDVKENLQSRFKLTKFNRRNMRKLEKGEPIRIQIKPPILSEDAMIAYYDNLFSELYSIGDLIIYIDEVYGVTQSATEVQPYLRALFTRGREVAKVGVFASVQRPTNIPLIFMSEAEHFFIFRLQMETDRKRVASIIGKPGLTPIEDKHGFLYFNNELSAPLYFKEL